MFRRFFEVLGLLMIGEGMAALIHPRRYLRLWRLGPEPCKKIVDEFVAHPEATRALAAAELALGIWLALYAAEAE
jgi:hypothetical protein